MTDKYSYTYLINKYYPVLNTILENNIELLIELVDYYKKFWFPSRDHYENIPLLYNQMKKIFFMR